MIMDNNTYVMDQSSAHIMRKYNALNRVYRHAYIEGLISCLPIAHNTRIRLFKQRDNDSQGIVVAWRAVGNAIGNAMLKVR